MINLGVSFGIVITFLLLFVTVLLYRYSVLDRKILKYIPIIYIVFFLTLMGILMLPIDISTTAYYICNETLSEHTICSKPTNFADRHTLNIFWRTIYWSLFCLSTFILPFVKAYYVSGRFTFCQKFKYAFKYNAIFYTIYFILFICLLLYMRFNANPIHINFYSIRSVLATTSNTVGIFLLILVMGFGLIDIPRNIYRSTSYEYQYKKRLLKITQVHDSLYVYEQKLNHLIYQTYLAYRVIPSEAKQRQYVLQIINNLPANLQDKITSNQITDTSNVEMFKTNTIFESILEFCGINPSEPKTDDDYLKIKVLSNLNLKIMFTLIKINSTKLLYNSLIKEAIFYEDLINSQNSTSKKKQIKFTLHDYSLFTIHWLPTVEYFYYMYIRNIFLKIVCLISIIISFVIFFSEITMSITSPTVSILSLIIKKLTVPPFHFITLQIFSVCILIYMSFCTYLTVFQLKFFDLIQIRGNHQTDLYSLLHSSTIIGYFLSPICINYLSMIHFDKSTLFKQSHSVETSFSEIEGRFEILPFISKYFYFYYPLIIILVALFSSFNILPFLMKYFGFGQSFLAREYSQNIISEGKTILDREKSLLAIHTDDSTIDLLSDNNSSDQNLLPKTNNYVRLS